MKKYKFQVAGISDVGTVKKVNEDGFVYKVIDAGEHFSGIFAVADGVGGLEKGDVASSIAISNINKWWENEFKKYYNDRENLVKSLITTLNITNKELITFATNQSIRMATTLSVLFIHKDDGIIVHIGDSRIYKSNPGTFSTKIEQLTQDHSCYVNKSINGRIVKKSVLTECLGNKDIINHFCVMNPVKKGDIYILGSDGIYKTMTEAKLAEVVKRNKSNMQELCENLVDTVKTNGEKDNISVIAIKVVD